ncbi:type I-C CRISPR-associated endonuclease Cas1c [Lapidilactobacillus wuchangensis]|uniref:type I-C CRISPR-associated endonuclease Cas1c n=1 Tax=Lapidilactobacillus wuchangensis TaxID=2486001 RepID=UPI000F79D667|nr:type I-C CRISPR-associated endonuclease Cas1c [Lapidilactobacillus wuchangensis]
MRKLLNTIYINSPEAYLALDGGNLVVIIDENKSRVPLVNIESIVSVGYRGVSPALMRYCTENKIGLAFVSRTGLLTCRLVGENNGNVLLRKTQYAVSESTDQALAIAQNFIVGKIYNQRWVIERMTRDHAARINVPQCKIISDELKQAITSCLAVTDIDSLRGIEGQAANRYDSVFGQFILQQAADFQFNGRSKRPPLDRVNALLSLTYTMLGHECAAALESVGLDAYVGFMHTDRPGRISLALDLMEELRAPLADRFVLRLVNQQIVNVKDFTVKENGAVLLTDDGRKKFFDAWQKRKNETMTHPYLNEKIEWGLIPYTQALLLSRYLRGDLDQYPPFLWK